MALNRHPEIAVTNELRAWNIVGRMARLFAEPSEMLPDHPAREGYYRFMLDRLVAGLRDFYEQPVSKAALGCPVPEGAADAPSAVKVWGDKNPGYADARNRASLALMADLLPDARFIHVHRDPRSCVASYLDTPVYSDDLDSAIDIWRRHVRTAVRFCRRMPAERTRSVRYESLVSAEGEAVMNELQAFLSIDFDPEPAAFLAAERARPTPYRSPATPAERIGETRFHERLSDVQLARVEASCGRLMDQLGYARLADGSR